MPRLHCDKGSEAGGHPVTGTPVIVVTGWAESQRRNYFPPPPQDHCSEQSTRVFPSWDFWVEEKEGRCR